MLILQKDFITLDLEKVGDWGQMDGTKNGPMLGLLITIQVNGKLKRSMIKIKTERISVGYGETKETYTETGRRLDVCQREGIHSAIELLNDIGYELDVMEVQTIILNSLNTLSDSLLNMN